MPGGSNTVALAGFPAAGVGGRRGGSFGRVAGTGTLLPREDVRVISFGVRGGGAASFGRGPHEVRRRDAGGAPGVPGPAGRC